MSVPLVINARETFHKGLSVYTQAPNDEKAVYFSSDGKTDESKRLQEVINELDERYDYGIIYIKEGEYILSKTIYIPGGIRLIGVGTHRPIFRLADYASGFGNPYPDDKGGCKYLFWFTHSSVSDETNVPDATSSTFYSAFSNIDVALGKGNPYAVAFRTHYAQHCFISHCNIEIGTAHAGIFDVGNEIHDVNFYGGDVGIYTTRTSPSWQMTMLDVTFENQRRAAVLTEEGGLTILRMTARRTPIVIEVQPNRSDKIYMEDCIFEDIATSGILESREKYAPNQLSLKNVYCSNVPVFATFRNSDKRYTAPSKKYVAEEMTLGLHMDDMATLPEFRTTCKLLPIPKMPTSLKSDIPRLPDVTTWANVKEFGAKGDGSADDTHAIKKALESNKVVYFPQGWYKVTESIKLGSESVLIGMNPSSTEIFIDDSTPYFSGFGSPAPLIETPIGGNNIINGIGIDAGTYNYRAVGLKWQSGKDSYLNDVRFFGGHSIVAKGTGKKNGRVRVPQGISTSLNPVTFSAKNKAWDNQHWSLWITNGGGGTFKDIWTPQAFATNGLYISNTDTPSRMYEVSVEHHVRNEVHLKNVHNWKFYALQLEEELLEGPDVQPIEMQDCSDLLFANLYLFRVIWIDTPLRTAIRNWGSKDIEFYNVHNFTQMRHTTDVTLKDMNTGLEVMPWEFTRLSISGNETMPQTTEDKVTKLVGGFEFIEGMTKDSKGNVYFSEQRFRRIYKWDTESESISLVSDLPWPVLSLACDTEDHILICVKYTPQPGAGTESPAKNLPDAAGSTYSHWGNTGFEPRFYSIDPLDPEGSMTVLPKVPFSSIRKISKAYYPSHRWRDLNDFDKVSTFVPDSCFIAPDGKTIIPEFYDLLRSSSLTEGKPGNRVYSSNEYDHRVVSLKVLDDGTLTDLQPFSTVGEFCACTDGQHVFVADGYLYMYDMEGNLIETVRIPERPNSIICSKGKLYIAARTSLYQMNYD